MSTAADGTAADAFADHAHISGDGRHVVLDTEADNLGAQPDLNESFDVYVSDLG